MASIGSDSDGQASVSFIATLPALIAVCAVLAQIAAVGWSAWSAAGAARAAARAELIGADAEAAAEAALPGPLANRAEVERAGERMRVRGASAAAAAPAAGDRGWGHRRARSAGWRERFGGVGWRRGVSSRRRFREAEGQAQVELVAVIPLAICLAAVILQLLAVGYSQSLADGAAEAGAYALAAGLPADEAALAALPRWAAKHADIETGGGRVEVSVQPPSLLDVVGKRLVVDSSAWARPADG